MSKLQDLQKNFIRDCLGGSGEFLLKDALNTDRISAEGQMGIYRESAIGNIISSMTLTYPSVENLVGAQFFRMMCRKFIEAHWPTSGNMNDYGAEFPDFLEVFEPAKTLAYLPDMARLDWLFHESSLANDGAVGDWGQLSTLPPDDISALVISVNPSVRIFSSAHPVIKIWEMCQGDADHDDVLNLTQESGIEVLLVRKHMKVDLYPLGSGETAFLKALQAGQALFDGFEAAMSIEPDAPVQGYLMKHIDIGTFADFS